MLLVFYNSAWKTLVAMVSGHQYQYELLLYMLVLISLLVIRCQKCHVSRQREKCFIERMILLYLKRDRSKYFISLLSNTPHQNMLK